MHTNHLILMFLRLKGKGHKDENLRHTIINRNLSHKSYHFYIKGD